MRRPGFTLIEVLIALAIIAISIGTAMRATSAAFVSSADIKDRTIARWIGRNELARLQAGQSLPEPGTLSGETTQGKAAFTWNAVVDSTPNPNFRKVEIVVRRLDGKHSLVTIQGFVVGVR
jgi:general secretion pathway protein I